MLRGLMPLVFLFATSVMAQNQKIVDSLLGIVKDSKQPDTTKIKAYNDLGFQYAPSAPKLALSYIQKALDKSEQLGIKRGAAGAFNCIGIVYFYQKEYDSALIYYRKALNINKELKHSWGQASALHQIGTVKNLQYNYQEAIQSFQEAGDIFVSTGDSLSFTKSVENIGVSYNIMGHKPKAIAHFLEAIKLYTAIDDVPGIGRGYYHLSTILIAQEDYQKALHYLEEALPKIKQGGNKQHLGFILRNMGTCHASLKQYGRALIYFLEALDHIEISGNPKTLVRIYSEIGDTYYKMGVYDEALDHLEKAVQNYPLTGGNRKKAITYNGIAKCHIALQDLAKAKIYVKKAIEVAEETDYLIGKKESYKTLAEITEREKNDLAALQLYKTYQAFKDSLHKLENQERVRELHTIYETDKKEQQISEQRNEIDLLEQKAKINQLERIVLGIGFLLISIVFVLLWYGLRQKARRGLLEKEKLNAELTFKKKELTTHALHLAKKNEVLDHLKQKAEALKTSKNPLKGYQQLIQTIDFDLKNDNHWKKFTQYFEEVHEDFFGRIKQRFPDISSNELRLMALLKMNLSSKEIANILNISPEGIKKARYRLRKKLNLNSDESLQGLILKI